MVYRNYFIRRFKGFAILISIVYQAEDIVELQNDLVNFIYQLFKTNSAHKTRIRHTYKFNLQ